MFRIGRRVSFWGLVAAIGIGSLALALLKPTVWQVVVGGGAGFIALIAAAALARWHLEGLEALLDGIDIDAPATKRRPPSVH